MAKNLKILIFPDPRLRKVAEKVIKFDKSLENLANSMLKTMYDANGIGLAATQIDQHIRLIVMDLSEERNEPRIFINPTYKVLEDHSLYEYEEGCLSIPGMLGLVRRFSKIKYSGYDLQGNKITNTAEGTHARIVQHEFDHLNGILYTSRLTHKDAFGYADEIEQYWKKNEEK